MFVSFLRFLRFRSWHFHVISMNGVALCIALWIRAKTTVDQDERSNAERRALFVGLWPPTLYLIGESLAREETPGRALRERLRRS